MNEVETKLLRSILDELQILNRREEHPRTWTRRYSSTRTAVFWGVFVAGVVFLVFFVAVSFAWSLRDVLFR